MYPSRTKFVLRGIGKPDEPYLDAWRAAPLTYQRGQAVDASWHADHYEYVIGAGSSHANLFERAADLLLRYQFYPPTIMAHVSDFGREGRRMRARDRIVQRIRSQRIPIEGLTMNAVTAVIDEPDRAGFSYVTTQVHAEMGEWSALIEKHADGVKLTIDAFSRTRPDFPSFLRGYARHAQKRAHNQGIAYFSQRVLAND
jgi:uncharacterized protein (UPF0548 family)